MFQLSVAVARQHVQTHMSPEPLINLADKRAPANAASLRRHIQSVGIISYVSLALVRHVAVICQTHKLAPKTSTAVPTSCVSQPTDTRPSATHMSPRS